MKRTQEPPVPPVSGRLTNPLVCTAFLLLAVSVKCADYQATVLSDGPRAYYRFNDDTGRSAINRNSGGLGAAGNATNDLSTGVVHPFPGALAGDGNRSEFFDSSARTIIPYSPALNPTNTHPFTVEAWFYPASDQINGGQCPINNRYAYSGVNRQGWVFFQRAPNLDYFGKGGYEGVGWNCRMYNENGGTGALDVTSQLPYQIGRWTHVVVVYDPVNVTNATLTMYIDGVAANTNTWTGGASGTAPGYVANTDDHPPSEAVSGPSGLALGQYNNTASPNSNPYFGAVDEFAFYTNKLSPAQILAHYQNGTNAARSIPYQTLVQSDNPVEYLRLDEIAPGPDIAINLGDLRNGGVATNAPGVRHPAQSALAGRIDDGAFSGHWRNGGGTFADIPWNAADNPDASLPFTFEGWFRPTADQMNPGPSPVNNRLANGIANRTGWVIYQRDPNDTYKGVPGDSGVGWTFRMYTGSGSGGQDVLTGVPYNVGEWQQLVVTWEPQTDVGPAVNGGVAWQGILTAYVDGLAVATNTAATYSANTNPTEDGRPPTDFAVGSYNLASGGGEEFEGDIDEVAFYNNYVLTPDQILAHYQTGTNSHPATNYETLVLTAPYDGAGTQRLMPATYLRFNDPAFYPVANSGTLGYVADGNLVLTTNQASGPQSPAYAGFEASNEAVPLDGIKQWASLNNPTGLNISGQITLEAWIKPGATQGDPARIISHGPPTPTVYDLSTYPLLTLSGSLLSSNEVFLRIEASGANYAVGSSNGTNTYRASYPIPEGDLGGANWVHLAGTYDGANWRLFRNGAPVATNAAAVGALPVDAGDWAIGSTGNGWADSFTGSIDEVAIYNVALSPSRIAAHYSTAIFGSHPLGIALSGGQVTITWSVGTLQQSDNVTGSFTDLLGVASPYKPSAGPATKFYRLRQ